MATASAYNRLTQRSSLRTIFLAGAAWAGFGSVPGASAFEIGGAPDWAIHWDNTFQYNLGIRAEGVNPYIGNNPIFSENDYKFPHAGSIVTNRFSVLSEFDAEKKLDNGGTAGFRFSGSFWKDFAYGDEVRNAPGFAAPGVPYSALGGYPNNHYSAYTERFYEQGAEVLDAFVFDNFKIGDHDASVKLGRLTQYWGNALIFGSQGINYSQNAADDIKGSAAPGTQAQELAIPRLQILGSFQITPELVLEGQYFGEFQGNRLPEGGTYLGLTDFLFSGPSLLEGALPRSSTHEPGPFDGNFGVKLGWSPSWLRGSASVYFRQFDETQPWAPLFSGILSPGGAITPTDYHIAYARHVKLYGFSMERQVGDYSTGLEVSYRDNTALNSTPLNAAQILANGSSNGSQGARGNTLNVIANVVSGLQPNALYQTGSAFAELAYTRKLAVTSNANLYNGVGNSGPAGGCPSGNRLNGCSTDDAISIAGQFDPTWLQVFPGVDIDAPIFAAYGIYGNAASLGAPVGQGALDYSIGVHALVRQVWNITLQYNGYHAITKGGLTNFAGVPAGTPGFPNYYAGGNSFYFYNDKDWISLTLRASF